MKQIKLLLIFIVLLNVQSILAQKNAVCPIVKFDTDWSEEICLRYKAESQFYSFTDNQEAVRYVEKLMNLAGLPMNFVVSECSGIQNAFAYTYDGIQYIFYGNEFLESLNSNSNDIGSISVLAHEIGHHLSGHTSAKSYISTYCNYQPCVSSSCGLESQDCLDAYKISRTRELQADRYAGYIMYKFGTSLNEAQNAFKLLADNREFDDTCCTHPTLSKRLSAIKEGYEEAKRLENEALERQRKRENGEEVEEPTEKEKLEDIKGDKIEFEYVNLPRIEKNKLISKIERTIAYQAIDYLNKNSDLSFGWGSGDKASVGKERAIEYHKYYDEKKWWYIDNNKETIKTYNQYITLSYDDDVDYGPKTIMHIKNGNIKLVILNTIDNNPKIVYQAPFKESEINFEELKMIYVKILKDGIQQKLKNKK